MTSFQKVIKYCAIGFALFLAVSIIYGIASAAIAFLGVVTGAPVFRDKDDKYGLVEDYNNINSLDIDISSCKLTIQTGDQFHVEAKNVPKDFKVEVTEDGVLKIRDDKSSHFLWFSINNSNAKVDLYLPQDFIAKNAEIENGAGEIEIDKLRAEKLIITTGAGRLKGRNIVADESALIENGAGEVVLKDVMLEDAVFDCGVGRVSVTGQLLGENTIDCGIGEVDLELTGRIGDYDINIDKGLGSARINGEKYRQSFYQNLNANHSIDVDGGIGSISIDIVE